MLELAEEQKSPTVIKVVGVGGAGMNAVDRMIAAGLQGVEFIAVNTDEQVLLKSKASVRITIGQKTTRGMGAGGDPDIGYRSAMEDQDRISQALRGADMIFITAGMGGGTGTGAAPIVAEIARSQGALVIGVLTLPFLRIEGQRRMAFAEQGLEALKGKVDTLIVIKNDSIFKVVDPKTSVDLAFRMIDDILLNAVRGISDLINTAGLVNVDFADVRAIMGETGEAVMGAGEGIGEERAAKAVNQAIHNALLEDSGIEGASAALINVCGGEDLGIFELKDVAELITRHLDPQANIIIGLTIDPSLEDRLRVIVIATGFHGVRGQAKVQEQAAAAGGGTGNPYWMSYISKEKEASAPFSPSPSLENIQKASNSPNSIVAIRRNEETVPAHSSVVDKENFIQSLSPEEHAALQEFSKSEIQNPNEHDKKKRLDLEDLDVPAYLRRKKET